MSTWLVTGGAGYIGAHVVAALQRAGETPVVLDDLSTGDPARISGVELVEGTLLDTDLLRATLDDHGVTGIVHIAAKKAVGESVERPLHYYRENVAGMLGVLEAAVDAGIESFLFSSSASTYGMPDVDLVTEDTATVPVSPYGETKLFGEWMASAAARASGLRAISLRYFNVAGAASPVLGDKGVFNLIPLTLRALTSGRAPQVYGNDYPTPDGTCVRDYVHVADVADAHLAAVRHLADGGGSGIYNVGRGEGSSVLDVLRVVADVSGNDREPKIVARRPGDPARIVASVDRIRDELGWTAAYTLRDMVESAWEAWPDK